MQAHPPPAHPARNLLRLCLVAGAVFLFAGCASVDDNMKRQVGQHISEVFREHGGQPNSGRSRVGNNRYAYTYKYYRTRYAGRQSEGSSQNGPIITNYYSDVCYGRNLYQTYYTDANDIVVDYHWEYTKEWRINCNEI
ncbi:MULTISPECIES: hypothetical protein [Eikenella]|uniref:Lipoprotein n=1 Tax=Eikenella exigua TaxID=2528037 RepID=A0AAX1F6B5_9NEIS|nr:MULTISPECIES: hypothetical protein [Eikenella]OAM28070.1 hypothetical protein A7P94_04915 [Eikenella sp. NML01-A-086]OAM42806.1 hypothetical protein A7Q02_03250 [Eikenella sp. NML97-A-109]QED91550.1 hypothetical protein EZJ17_02015 [Eikenella exigua]